MWCIRPSAIGLILALNYPPHATTIAQLYGNASRPPCYSHKDARSAATQNKSPSRR